MNGCCIWQCNGWRCPERCEFLRHNHWIPDNAVNIGVNGCTVIWINEWKADRASDNFPLGADGERQADRTTHSHRIRARAREREKAFRCAARYGLCDYLTRNPVYVLCACVRSTFMPIVLRCQMLFGCLMVSGHYNVIRISHRDYVAKHEVHLTLIFRFYLYSISETRLTGGIVLFNGSHKTLLINTVFVWSFARFYVYTLELDDGQQWDIHIYSGAVGRRIVIHFIRYAWTIWWWTNAFH